MNDNVFIDTNVFVYLYSEDEQEKQITALDILEQTHCVTSTQVLNEFCSVCLRKLGKSSDEVLLSIEEIVENCELCYIDMAVIQKALTLNKKYGYTYYDCLILASAISTGCKYLYSEDMQHNQIIDEKLRIINPFL
jgi:predicted nucleic acid-binding protein